MIATLRWLCGPILWAVHFLLVYASESLVCSRGAGAGDHRLLVAVASTSIILALVAVILLGLRRIGSDTGAHWQGTMFMDRVGVVLAAGSLVAVLWTILPALVVSACLPPA